MILLQMIHSFKEVASGVSIKWWRKCKRTWTRPWTTNHLWCPWSKL